MLEIEIVGEDNHIFVVHIESVLNTPVRGQEIKCGVCGDTVVIRSVGVPGRIREPKPTAKGQKKLFEE